MDKVIIVPDIHGRTFWKDSLTSESCSDIDKIVFLGDYVDPYGYEGITMDDAISNFKDIINYKKQNMDKVILLLGNHDWTYILPKKFKSSRHDYVKEKDIQTLFLDNISLFQMVYDTMIGDKRYIFSHAGIHPEWMRLALKTNNIDSVIALYSHPVLEIPSNALDSLDCVSWRRGGMDAAGSMTWADVDEYAFFKHDPSYYQIFGHTQQPEGPIITSHYACLDCRKLFKIDSSDNLIQELI